MQLIINGEAREFSNLTRLTDLLKELDVSSRFVAIEVNEELVPRSQHAEFELRSGDKVEVVTLVGGG